MACSEAEPSFTSEHRAGPGQEEQSISVNYYIVSPDQKDLLDGLVNCVTDAFMNGEPLVKALQFTKEEYRELPETYVHERATDGLHLAAVSDDGKVIGGFVQGDFALGAQTLVGFERKPKFKELMPLLNESEALFTDSVSKKGLLVPGKVMFQFMVGVDKGLRGWRNAKGHTISQELGGLSLKLAKQKGFVMAMGEATNPGSQIVAQKLGYDVSSIVVPYKKFKAFEAIDFGEKAVKGIGNGLSVAFRSI